MEPFILGWPKSSFGFFRTIVWKNPNELFGQPNIFLPCGRLKNIFCSNSHQEEESISRFLEPELVLGSRFD